MGQTNPSENLANIFDNDFKHIVTQLQDAINKHPKSNLGFALVVIANNEDFLNFSVQNASDKSIRSISKEFSRLCPPADDKRFNLIYPN